MKNAYTLCGDAIAKPALRMTIGDEKMTEAIAREQSEILAAHLNAAGYVKFTLWHEGEKLTRIATYVATPRLADIKVIEG